MQLPIYRTTVATARLQIAQQCTHGRVGALRGKWDRVGTHIYRSQPLGIDAADMRKLCYIACVGLVENYEWRQLGAARGSRGASRLVRPPASSHTRSLSLSPSLCLSPYLNASFTVASNSFSVHFECAHIVSSTVLKLYTKCCVCCSVKAHEDRSAFNRHRCGLCDLP